MTLDVTIATWQPSGIRRIAEMNLPHVAGVRYIVSWQEYGDNPVIPPELQEREDLDIYLFEKKGTSANRNNALAHSNADIILISDDDLSYTPEALKAIIKVMEENPDVDLATFCGEEGKIYPSQPTDLGKRLPKYYYFTAIEIAFRRHVKERVQFDEAFGPGAPVWQAAEEVKFMYDVRRLDFRCRFFPITITTHPGASTGSRVMAHPGVAAAQGKAIRLEYPLSWPLRVALKSWRERKKGGDFLFCLKHQLRGALSSGKGQTT